MTLTVGEPLLQQNYVSYTYAYPHKTAYRKFQPPIPLNELWATERRDALFLYFHIPFCEMRCGFCNLFTTVNPKLDFVAAYLDTLERQARRVRYALGDAKFARLAIGGGTPTFLTTAELERVFDLATNLYGVDLSATPISVETSPGTSEPDKLQLLRERNVDRISIGVQSFVESEVHAVGRAQKTPEVFGAIERIKRAGFPVLNIDLIYGMPQQTVGSWLYTIESALSFAPEELYLYPLYNRPLTGLEKLSRSWDDVRLELYRIGRERLLSAGYEQVSMRMFRKKDVPEIPAPIYCCQQDGMVGLGCGARSYTSGLHYASDYAVSAPNVKAILADYIKQPDEVFDAAQHGFRLDADEQHRRYLLQSLLQVEGVEFGAYRERFGTDALSDFPMLGQLVDSELAKITLETLRLTPAGLEKSDAIGPWLYSPTVRARMEAYELK